MSMTQVRWAIALGVTLGLSVAHAAAQGGAWRPAARPAAAAPARPAAVLGRPIALDSAGPASALPPLPGAADITQVSHAEPIPATWSEAVIIRAQAPDPGGPPPVPPPGIPPAPPYQVDPTVPYDQPINGAPPGEGFWGKATGWTKKCSIKSDHCFDGMISPVTNPFFFEDPRSLTEVRPVFIYQKAPESTPIYGGGSSEFFGVQARLALSPKWSVVINKLGWVALHPDNELPGVDGNSGFAEFNIGPKWTFLRNENTQSVVAAGLNFQIPTSGKAAQDTGTVGLDPYITYAQSFGRLPQGWGAFNFVGQAGYNFSVDNERAQYFHTSLHLDYDVANLHRFYPLIELNYFYQTKKGDARALGFEGADLVNFGSSNVSGTNLLSLALGARYKFSEWAQIGGAIEFPVTDRKDLADYRLTFDLIFRY